MSNIADIIDNLFTFISSLASFVISLIVISRTSIWCILPIIAFFAVAYRMNMLSKKISHNTWLDQTTDRRYAYYLGSLFFDRHIMKEIKTWQTQNMIIDKWSDLTNKMRMERLANDKKSNCIHVSDRLRFLPVRTNKVFGKKISPPGNYPTAG